MHATNSPPKGLKNPRSPLIRDPYIRLRIIEAKDVFLSTGTRKEVGDLYLRATYESEVSQKTNVVTKSSAPKWNSTWEFDYYVAEGQEGNAISISIYDADPLGSDELIATQFISLSYFKDKNQFGTKLDMWLKLHNAIQNDEAIMVETDASLYNDLNLPEFEDEIVKDLVVHDDDKVPKLHICLEIYDPVSINHISISIPETEEFKEGGLLECTVFLYVIKVLRNDGLEWLVKRRYSQMRSLKSSLSERVREVKELEFPSKNLLKFTSKLFSSLDKDYKKIGVDRRKALEHFLSRIVEIEPNYQLQDFVKFFSEDE